MKSKIGLGLILTLPFVFYLFMSNSKQELYFKHSLERHKLCLEQTNELNMSPTVCSQINFAVNEAYSSSANFDSPMITLLMVIIWGLAFGLFNLSDRLKKLENKE
jgi:hypothetical protein